MNKLGLLALTGGSGGSNITLSNTIDQSTTSALTPKAVYDEVAKINGKFMKDMTLTGSTKELKLTYNNGRVYTVDLTAFISAIINGMAFGSIITVDAKPTCASGTITYVKGGSTLTTTNLHTTFLWEDNGEWKHTMFSSDGDEVTFSTDIDLTGYLTIAQGDSKYVAKNDMSTTIDSTSTNSKVATAKAVYDFGDNFRLKSKVADVPKTSITFSDTSIYEPQITNFHNHYEVIDGECYVSLYVKAIAPTNQWTLINASLPKAKRDEYKSLGVWDNGTGNVICTIDTIGRLQLRFGTVGTTYIGTFRYKVAE